MISSSNVQSQVKNNSSRILKKFAVVSFPKENNCLAVVPKKWLFTNSQNNYMCKWPLLIDRRQVINLVKNDSDPDISWPTYPAHLIYTSNVYSYAETAMCSYQESCETNSISENTDVESHHLQLIPKPEEIFPDTGVESYRIQLDFEPEENSITDSQPSVMGVRCSSCTEMEKKVNNLEQEILAVKKIVMEVKAISSSALNIMQKLDRRNNLHSVKEIEQLKTVEDISCFEERLEDPDEFSKMCEILTTIGGTNVKDCTRRILQCLISDDLASKFNWKGLGGVKLGFSAFKRIIKLILGTVRNNSMCTNATESEVTEVMKKWLVHARDREIYRHSKFSEQQNKNSNI